MYRSDVCGAHDSIMTTQTSDRHASPALNLRWLESLAMAVGETSNPPIDCTIQGVIPVPDTGSRVQSSKAGGLHWLGARLTVIHARDCAGGPCHINGHTLCTRGKTVLDDCVAGTRRVMRNPTHTAQLRTFSQRRREACEHRGPMDAMPNRSRNAFHARTLQRTHDTGPVVKTQTAETVRANAW